ncbi:MAG: hypothetical protein GY928_02215 [Colwellia sp.]|nr:hypothetical protein [Colwellia sp.]
MGSKRKLSDKIVAEIIQRHEGIDCFYDLFGGGGSISLQVLKYKNIKTHYNELNKSIYSLLKYLRDSKKLDYKFYEWVNREEFFNQIEKDDGDWFAGYVMSCWSFGNKQNTYLYGKDIEENKRLAHETVVNRCHKSAEQLGFNEFSLFDIDDLHKRRKVFCKYWKKKGDRVDMQELERVQEYLQKSKLQSLSYLENMQRLQELEMTNLSYQDVKIHNDSAIIYCDIPYKGTGEYKEGGFNHDKFYEWFSNVPNPAYLSEYDAPFELIWQHNHRSTLSATNNHKTVKERLFWNGKGDITKTRLF